MKKTALGCFVMLFWFQIGVSQDKKQDYTSELGKFSIVQYAPVRERTQTTENSTVYRAAYRYKNMMFVVSSTLEKHKVKNVSTLLKASVNAFLTAVKGTPISQRNIQEKKHKGIYTAANLQANNVHVEYKVFTNKQYLYQVMIFAKNDVYDQKLANAYFKSFTILK